MRTVVLDTSVLVQLFLGEPGFEAARALMEAYAAGRLPLAAPESGLLEFANVLAEHEQRGRLKPEEVDLMLEDLLGLGIRWIPASGLLAQGALFARRTGRGVRDGAFLALAERLDATFVTADASLVEACRGKLAFVTPLEDAVEALGL
ncbi:MAG: type II toxin-antitoxin system VapC family toxin [Planctomycetota bacterium]